MAAYAALVSLFNTLDHIHNHPRFSATLNKYQIESVGAHIDFLLGFVETNNIDGGLSLDRAQELKRQIICAAHEAEDIIESHIVDLVLPGSPEISDVCLHRRCFFGLQKVIQDMDSLKEKVMQMKEESGFNHQKPTNSTPAALSTAPATVQTRMVGFEEELMQLKDVLIGHQSSRQIISIVGMGGAGKTTLAQNVYEDSLTMHHFDLRAWATISQDYNVTDILSKLLSVADGKVDELGDLLYKKLFGRRYLIVLDDMWSMEVWDRIKFFFPDNGDGSRIIITTRLSNMATQLCSICIRINFLDGDRSWNLFCEKVFGQKAVYPVDLEKIGKKIVEQCKGLPLSLVVIGGLLKKSCMSKEYWHSVARNINAILNSRENGQCLDILYLSYSHLPAHLKPCFLYMGIFREDSEIRVSQIIKLWVAEGFLKPNGVQILEEMAEDYLKDLVERNLILVCGNRSNGKMRSFRIHDLLRDVCLRVGVEEKFFCVVRKNIPPQSINRKRRLLRHKTSRFKNNKACKVFHRSLVCNVNEAAPSTTRLLRVFYGASGISTDALRVFYGASDISTDAKIQNVNLRYVNCPLSVLPCSISMMWNLQTLIIDEFHLTAQPQNGPSEIWKLTQLRHLMCSPTMLPNPPPSDHEDDSVVLGKLQTLTCIMNFRLSAEACKRIPHVKKLRISYGDYLKVRDYSLYDDLQNLGRLQRLESIHIRCLQELPISKLKNAFPNSLNKLVLRSLIPNLEELSTVIGSLPQLEVLKVTGPSKRLKNWCCVEGEFLRLKFLSIGDTALESWTLDGAVHFPVLEKLILIRVAHLKEIPSGIGEIPTLQLIRLEHCTESLVISAMKIKEEQENFGNDGTQIQVMMYPSTRQAFRERVEVEGLSIKTIHHEV